MNLYETEFEGNSIHGNLGWIEETCLWLEQGINGEADPDVVVMVVERDFNRMAVKEFKRRTIETFLWECVEELNDERHNLSENAQQVMDAMGALIIIKASFAYDVVYSDEAWRQFSPRYLRETLQ